MANTKSPAGGEPAKVVAGDPVDRKGRLRPVGGSKSDRWNNLVANQTIQSLWFKHSDEEARDRQINGTVAALVGIGPKDELEGMMAAQLIAAHNAAMECYRRAMISDQSFEGRRENLNQANKLSRTHATLVDALNRHRGKGQQKVTVEHVHVHSGGQAVVGVVAAPGGRPPALLEEQPHAKQIGHAPESSLRSENESGGALPVAGDAQRSLPDARRHVTGRTQRE